MPNKTFYITQSNADSLSSEDNQSGLVNNLLNAYYAGKRRVSLNEIGTSPVKEQRFEQLKQAFPPLNIKEIVETDQTIAPPEYSA